MDSKFTSMFKSFFESFPIQKLKCVEITCLLNMGGKGQLGVEHNQQQQLPCGKCCSNALR